MAESTGVHAITCRTRVPLSQRHLTTTTIFESVVDGGQERGREREGRKRERKRDREGKRQGVPPSNPLLDSSPALDCSIATTRGMLSTTATKCAEEIPMLSSPLTPSRLARQPMDLRFSLAALARVHGNHDRPLFHPLTFIDRVCA